MSRREWILFPAALAFAAVAVAAEPAAPAPSPNEALDLYLARLPQSRPWNEASVEVEASIPRLSKVGRLRAIRRLLPFGRPEYQVLESEGDATVKKQVIARYLSAEAEAALIPPASVAITPENYKFRFVGAVGASDSPVYRFRITPRKKRAGLIKGDLWIDARTGLALRQSGNLVRKPSIFLRRVDIARDTDICGDEACARVTHVNIDVRLFGKAELTIVERPYNESIAEAAAAGAQ